jgi:hypothetical protein
MAVRPLVEAIAEVIAFVDMQEVILIACLRAICIVSGTGTFGQGDSNVRHPTENTVDNTSLLHVPTCYHMQGWAGLTTGPLRIPLLKSLI